MVALRAGSSALVSGVDATGERHPPETVEIVTRALNRVAAALHDPSVRASESARNSELREYQRPWQRFSE